MGSRRNSGLGTATVASTSRSSTNATSFSIASGCSVLVARTASNSVPDGFKRYCKSQSDEETCKASGCQYNKKGCTAKFAKVDCSRIRIKTVCEGVHGCSVRRKQNKKGRICKGAPKWDEPTKKNKKNDDDGR